MYVPIWGSSEGDMGTKGLLTNVGGYVASAISASCEQSQTISIKETFTFLKWVTI